MFVNYPEILKQWLLQIFWVFLLKDHNLLVGLYTNFWVLGSISSSRYLFISIYGSYICLYILYLLGSKTLGTNVLELQFVLCWQTMIKTQSLGLSLLKVCLFVKLESSDCRSYWTKSTRLDRLKIRLDQSNHVQIYFSAEFQFSPNST